MVRWCDGEETLLLPCCVRRCKPPQVLTTGEGWCGKLGQPPEVSQKQPEGVQHTAAADQGCRVECVDS